MNKILNPYIRTMYGPDIPYIVATLYMSKLKGKKSFFRKNRLCDNPKIKYSDRLT